MHLKTDSDFVPSGWFYPIANSVVKEIWLDIDLTYFKFYITQCETEIYRARFS